ncbi:hypothetical protein [Xanthomonas campestris]|uniref:hypothetical protein n=1 Tax=Xanthomonas campestris TaxID=339 RepID=UPI00388EB45A
MLDDQIDRDLLLISTLCDLLRVMKRLPYRVRRFFHTNVCANNSMRLERWRDWSTFVRLGEPSRSLNVIWLSV